MRDLFIAVALAIVLMGYIAGCMSTWQKRKRREALRSQPLHTEAQRSTWDSNVVAFNQIDPPTPENVERVLDSLRDDLMSGRIKGFVGVGIAVDHNTYLYKARRLPMTQLEVLGALAHTMHCQGHDDE